MNGTAEERKMVKKRLKRLIDAASRAYLAIDIDETGSLADALEQMDQDHRELTREVCNILVGHG